MNRNYIFLTLLMLVLAFGTLFIKRDNEPNQIEPQQLLAELIQPTRYVTTDQVAKLIIKKDPSLMLLDVRDAASYENYSLPGSVNVPIDSMMSKNYLSYLGIPGVKVVFFSNDDIKADQAWVLAKRLGFKSTYVMKGGLNCWMQTIIDPQEPGEEEPYSAYETYTFRKGAQLYFTGAKSENIESTKVKVQVRRKEKSSVAAGGC